LVDPTQTWSYPVDDHFMVMQFEIMTCLCRIALVCLKYVLSSVAEVPTIATMTKACMSVKLNWDDIKSIPKRSSWHLDTPFTKETVHPVQLGDKESMLLIVFNCHVSPHDPVPPFRFFTSVTVNGIAAVRIQFSGKFVWFVDTTNRCFRPENDTLVINKPYCAELLFTSLYWSRRSNPYKDIHYKAVAQTPRISPRMINGKGGEMVDVFTPKQGEGNDGVITIATWRALYKEAVLPTVPEVSAIDDSVGNSLVTLPIQVTVMP
jgi:hypothetical protein